MRRSTAKRNRRSHPKTAHCLFRPSLKPHRVRFVLAEAVALEARIERKQASLWKAITSLEKARKEAEKAFLPGMAEGDKRTVGCGLNPYFAEGELAMKLDGPNKADARFDRKQCVWFGVAYELSSQTA